MTKSDTFSRVYNRFKPKILDKPADIGALMLLEIVNQIDNNASVSFSASFLTFQFSDGTVYNIPKDEGAR